MAMVLAFGPALQRAQIVGALVAVAIAIAWIFVGGDDASAIIPLVIVSALAGILGAIVALLVVPGRVRRAFEAFSWLGRSEVDRFEARTGGRVPVGMDGIAAWLVDHPATPSLLLARVEILAFVGRVEEARAELAAAASDPAFAFERASLRQYIDWIETGDPGVAELRAAAESVAPGTEARQAADVTVALAEARDLVVRGDSEWAAPLEAARRDLGRAPWKVVLRDTWSKAAVAIALVALVAAFGASLLRFLL